MASPKQLIEKAETLKNLLVAWGTGEQSDHAEYAELRRELLGNPLTAPFLPAFIRTCRTRLEFWGFIQPKFRTYAERREFIRREFDRLLSHLEESTYPNVTPQAVHEISMSFTPSTPAVFISHSSKDSSVAEALAELIRAAFALPADQIRCTSVSGYRLQIGADTDETLRREVNNAVIFVGLITDMSIDSAYVLFELGARWGANKHLAPLLAAGASHNLLKGPLSGINALTCGDRSQVLQLVSDLARVLGRSAGVPVSYDKHVDRVVETSRLLEARNQNKDPTIATPSPTSLEELEERILEILADAEYSNKSSLVRALQRPRTLIEYHLHRLENLNFINSDDGLIADGDSISLDQLGREYLVNRGYFKGK